jgi:hypothetical protein
VPAGAGETSDDETSSDNNDESSDDDDDDDDDDQLNRDVVGLMGELWKTYVADQLIAAGDAKTDARKKRLS